MARPVHAAGLVIERADGRILVLRRHPDDPEGNLLGLVGGKVESAEKVQDALLREVEEEIGVAFSPAQIRHVKQFHWDFENLAIKFDVYELTAPVNELEVKLDDAESTEFRWEWPEELSRRTDLMRGLYLILRDRNDGVLG